MNDVTVLGGEGVNDFVTKSLVMVTMMWGRSKIVWNCVSSFMDDPFS